MCPTEIELISKKHFFTRLKTWLTFLCSISNLFPYLPLPLTKVTVKERRVTPARGSLVKKSDIIGLLSLLENIKLSESVFYKRGGEF